MADHLPDLIEFLKIPSISTQSEHKSDIRVVVDWLKDYLTGIGFAEQEIQELYPQDHDWSNANPVLFAEKISNADAKTILIYGHYDVQPVDPIDQWVTPPFEPTIRDGNIYARGATDDKGQVFTYLAALKELVPTWGTTWPINIKLVLEGEEEIGSAAIRKLVAEQPEKFTADIAMISDGPWEDMIHPTIEYGLRGIALLQIDLKIADADLHSGLFGGTVHNPANVLADIIAKLKDSHTGKVLIPGFYDAVVPIDEHERAVLAEVPFDEAEFLQSAAGAKVLFGEEGYTTKERQSARPTLDVNGMWSGYQGEGGKTIIPASAHAKISMRLVANQDETKIEELFDKYVRSLIPSGVEVDIINLRGGPPVLVDIGSEIFKTVATIAHEIFGEEVVFSRSGGTVYIVSYLQKIAGIKDILMLNYGLPDDGLHSPNEKFSLDNFTKAINCNKSILLRLAN